MKDFFKEGYTSFGKPDAVQPTDLKDLILWRAGRDRAKLENLAYTYGNPKPELKVGDIARMRETVEKLGKSLEKLNQAYPSMQQVAKNFANSLGVNMAGLIRPFEKEVLWETPSWDVPAQYRPLRSLYPLKPKTPNQKFKKRKKWK